MLPLLHRHPKGTPALTVKHFICYFALFVLQMKHGTVQGCYWYIFHLQFYTHSLLETGSGLQPGQFRIYALFFPQLCLCIMCRMWDRIVLLKNMCICSETDLVLRATYAALKSQCTFLWPVYFCDAHCHHISGNDLCQGHWYNLTPSQNLAATVWKVLHIFGPEQTGQEWGLVWWHPTVMSVVAVCHAVLYHILNLILVWMCVYEFEMLKP